MALTSNRKLKGFQISILSWVLLITTSQHGLGQKICSSRPSVLTEEVKNDERPYHLSFSDEFNGASIDTSAWIPAVGVVRHVETTRYWLDPDNILVKDGILSLRAKTDTLLNRCYSIWIDTAMRQYCNDFFLSAGEIRTKAEFGYGIFEIRCKLPRGKGLTFAFWAYGREENEIDVFEFRNEYNIFGRVKKKKLSSVQRTNMRTDFDHDKQIEDCSAPYRAKDLDTDYHVYSVEWTPNKMVWRLDGKVIRTSTLYYSEKGKMLEKDIPAGTRVLINEAFPRNPMQIYVNLGLQSGKNSPDNSTVFPAYYEVDYVRYYKR